MFDILSNFLAQNIKHVIPHVSLLSQFYPCNHLQSQQAYNSYVGYSSLNVICKSMLKLAKTCKGLQDELKVWTLQVYIREPGV